MPWSYGNIDWNGTGAMVQAIGSAAAIAWGVWVYKSDGDKRRAASTEARLAVVRAALHATRYAADQIREVVQKVRVDELWFERLEWAGDLLKEVRVLEADDDELTDVVVAARSRLRQAERQAKRLNASRAGGPTGAFEDAKRQLTVLRDKVDSDVERLALKYSD